VNIGLLHFDPFDIEKYVKPEGEYVSHPYQVHLWCKLGDHC